MYKSVSTIKSTIKTNIILCNELDQISTDKKFRRTKFSTNKIFRRTKFSTLGNFDSFFR